MARSPSPSVGLLPNILRQVSGENLHFVSDKKVKVDLEIASNFIQTPFPIKAYERLRASGSTKMMQEYVSMYQWGYRSIYPSKSDKRIWFTGENLRPPIGIFDATYSCDKEDKVTGNYFLPYWFHRINWGFGDNGFEFQPQIEELLQRRPEELRERNACSFSSTNEPNRRFVNFAVGKALSLDEYGKFVGRQVRSKKLTASNYGFQVCTENDVYPNYVTEKIIEAWMSGNVPIWSGSDQHGFFNKDAIVNVTGLTSDEISEFVREISDEQATYMRSLPILNSPPSLDRVILSLSSLFN